MGLGCTKAGGYHNPNALLNSNYTGFEVTWTSTSVQPYSSGVPLYWTAGMTYKNVGSSTLTLGCPGNWADASNVRQYMSGGKGNDGMVAADSTTCSENPSWTASVAPGGIAEVYVTFHNVPWPGVAVAIQWGETQAHPPTFTRSPDRGKAWASHRSQRRPAVLTRPAQRCLMQMQTVIDCR